MEHSDEESFNFTENYLLITSRKTDFSTRFIEKFRSEHKELVIDDLIFKVAEIISKMDPLLFISEKERKEGHLWLKTPLSDISLREIGEEIAKCMNIID